LKNQNKVKDGFSYAGYMDEDGKKILPNENTIVATDREIEHFVHGQVKDKKGKYGQDVIVNVSQGSK
jgi:hypothetical protein